MDITCAICLESFTSNCEVSSTPCGHLFHSKCLSRSITRTQNTCPTCRAECGQKIRKVYLQGASSIPETAQQSTQQRSQRGAHPGAQQSTQQSSPHFSQQRQQSAHQSARKGKFLWHFEEQSAQQRALQSARQSAQQCARQSAQENLEQRLEAGGCNPDNILGPSALELARQIARSQLTLSSVSTQQSAQQSAQDSDVQPAQQFLFDNNGQVIHPIQRTVQRYNKIFSKNKQEQEQQIKQQEQKKQ